MEVVAVVKTGETVSRGLAGQASLHLSTAESAESGVVHEVLVAHTDSALVSSLTGLTVVVKLAAPQAFSILKEGRVISTASAIVSGITSYALIIKHTALQAELVLQEKLMVYTASTVTWTRAGEAGRHSLCAVLATII